MFTGIITNVGKLTKKEQALFTFQTDKAFCKIIENGTSVAINGICLTVCTKTSNTFSITVMPETVKKTMIGGLEVDNLVNLELPVTPETFLSGHIVQGHVDATGTIIKIEEQGNSKIVTIEIPEYLNKYIVEKGSIALNGISLTVIECTPLCFTVGIIPYTWEHTMLQQINVGDKVNIETDILAKYIEKLVGKKVQK